MDSGFPVLVVDDDIVLRTLVERQLKKAGFEVSCAENGKAALSLLNERFYPIVLTDWMMPEMDGPDLCRRIRTRKSEGYIFIILITARNSKTDIVTGLDAGADDYLVKPIHPAELIARINTGIRILKLEQSLKSANEEIRFLSITDPLTGCFNRAYLNERFPQELQRSRRYGHPLSVVIADIDHFKKINDTYGHQVGDMVLKKFSSCLIRQIREKIDWVVRYGGEEFLIILPETNRSGMLALSERLRQAVAGLAIDLDECHVRITASFGGACAGFGNECRQVVSMEQLINLADEQLYCSKREGRDCVHGVEIHP